MFACHMAFDWWKNIESTVEKVKYRYNYIYIYSVSSDCFAHQSTLSSIYCFVFLILFNIYWIPISEIYRHLPETNKKLHILNWMKMWLIFKFRVSISQRKAHSSLDGCMKIGIKLCKVSDMEGIRQHMVTRLSSFTFGEVLCLSPYSGIPSHPCFLVCFYALTLKDWCFNDTQHN